MSGLRKRQRAVIVVVTALFTATLLVGCLSYPSPDFERLAEPIVWENRVSFTLPRSDIEAGNGIACVFVDSSAERDVVSVVFEDEDHPWIIVDHSYDLIRWFKYGRVMDVETFVIEYGDETAIRFPCVHSGDQEFNTLLGEHFSKRVPLDAFRSSGSTVVHVRTWNHMFGETSSSRADDEVEVRSYPVYRGDRAACEAVFRTARR